MFKHLSEIENKRVNFTPQAHSRTTLAIHMCIVAQHSTVTSLSIEINNDKLLCCNLSQRFEPMPVSQLVIDQDAKNNFKNNTMSIYITRLKALCLQNEIKLSSFRSGYGQRLLRFQPEPAVP